MTGHDDSTATGVNTPRATMAAEVATGDPPRPKNPKTLPLAALHAAPDVFQMRHPLLSLTRLPEAVAALWRLIRQGVTLDPMTVCGAGNGGSCWTGTTG